VVPIEEEAGHFGEDKSFLLYPGIKPEFLGCRAQCLETVQLSCPSSY